MISHGLDLTTIHLVHQPMNCLTLPPTFRRVEKGFGTFPKIIDVIDRGLRNRTRATRQRSLDQPDLVAGIGPHPRAPRAPTSGATGADGGSPTGSPASSSTCDSLPSDGATSPLGRTSSTATCGPEPGLPSHEFRVLVLRRRQIATRRRVASIVGTKAVIVIALDVHIAGVATVHYVPGHGFRCPRIRRLRQ